MFTYFILMLVSTICGALLSLLISYSIFIRRNDISRPIHRGSVRMKLVESLIDRLYAKIDDQDNYIENTEKFILDQLNQEIDQIRDEIASHIIDIEAKIETINKLD